MSKKSGKSAASAASGASSGGGVGAPRGVSFAADAVGVSLSAPEQLQRLLSLPSDSARLESLKSLWAREMPPALDAFVRHCASEMTAQCAHYVEGKGAHSFAAHTSLRNLLGVVSLLARREYPAPSGTRAAPLPLEVFPKLAQAALLLLEADERPVEPAPQTAAAGAGTAAAAAAAAAQQAPTPNAIKFHALHAFNRMLEGFPVILGAFVPLLVDVVGRQLDLPAEQTSLAYTSKLVETLGLVSATHPAALVATGHTLLKQTLDMLTRSLDGIEEYERPTSADEAQSSASASAAPAKAALPAVLTKEQQLTVDLIDVAASLLRKLHVRLPHAYPSARYLHPRSWPFGSEEWAEAAQDAEPANTAGQRRDDDDEDANERDQDDDDDAEQSDAGVPRSCYTEVLPLVPARAGVQPLVLGASAAETGEYLSTLLTRLEHFHRKVGVEGEGSTVAVGVVNDAGTTVLAFMPLLIAVSNQTLCNLPEPGLEEHGRHVEAVANFAIEQLRELDLTAFSPSVAASTHQYLQCVEGAFKYANRAACLDFVHLTYNDLVNWLGDAQQSFPRAAFIKLRRFAVSAFLALLYTMDTLFQSSVGSSSFFAELFPLLANPLLTSHLLWLLREEREHAQTKVLPQVMRGLLNTNTRQSPSVKTVQMILTSLGNVACFTRAFDAPAQPADAGAPAAAGSAVLPLLTPYMSQLLETISNTMEKSPSGTGQTASLVLCRILMAGYDMPEVQGFFSRILSLYQRIVDESLFVAEQEEAGDEYDEDDQDLVSQLQYCVLDMLHLLFQQEDGADKEAAIAAPADNAPHPFDQQRFLTLLLDDEDNIEVLRSIVHVLLENSKKPLFFNDDGALRNSEVHLLKELLAHPRLFEALLLTAPSPDADADADSDDQPLPPLTVARVAITLLNAAMLAKEDGQEGRKLNYDLCLSSLTAALNAHSEALVGVKAALEAAENSKLLADVKRDAATSKIVEQWSAAAGGSK